MYIYHVVLMTSFHLYLRLMRHSEGWRNTSVTASVVHS